MRIDFKVALYALIFGLGIAVAGVALPMRYPNIPPLILDIMIYGGLTIAFGSFLLIIYELVIKPRLAKKAASKISISIHDVSSIWQSHFIWKIAFGNETSKQCIIESISITTFNNDDLLLINKHDNINLENNYKNMFDKHKMVSFPCHLIRTFKSPVTLTPGDLWSYGGNEGFHYRAWSNIYESKNIIRIPVGIMIRFIDFSRQSRAKFVAPFAEIFLLKDGKIDHILSFSREDNLLID